MRDEIFVYTKINFRICEKIFLHIRKFIAVRTALFRLVFGGKGRGLGRLSEGGRVRDDPSSSYLPARLYGERPVRAQDG